MKSIPVFASNQASPEKVSPADFKRDTAELVAGSRGGHSPPKATRDLYPSALKTPPES